MGFFSKAGEHAIRAAIYLAGNSDANNRKVLHDIATAIDSPEAFTAKILQALVKAGVIHSIKGPYGGFFMDEEQRTGVSLKRVVTAIDGDELFTRCALGLKACSGTHPCPVHAEMLQIRESLQQTLTQTTMNTLITNHNIHLKC